MARDVGAVRVGGAAGPPQRRACARGRDELVGGVRSRGRCLDHVGGAPGRERVLPRERRRAGPRRGRVRRRLHFGKCLDPGRGCHIRLSDRHLDAGAHGRRSWWQPRHGPGRRPGSRLRRDHGDVIRQHAPGALLVGGVHARRAGLPARPRRHDGSFRRVRRGRRGTLPHQGLQPGRRRHHRGDDGRRHPARQPLLRVGKR